MEIMVELIKLSIMIQMIIISFVIINRRTNKMSDYNDFQKELTAMKERMAYNEGVHDFMIELLNNEIINMCDNCYDIKIEIIHQCTKMYKK